MPNSDRLLAAARRALVEDGSASISARSIAASAGASASSINYHFGNLEQLFARVFEAELASLPQFAAGLLEEIADLPDGPRGARVALVHVVRRWVANRERALLYAEARSRAASESVFGSANALFWREFWRQVAALLRLPSSAGALLHVFFESEALFHLSLWRPALEDAALYELCECLVRRWIDVDDAPQNGVGQSAYRRAMDLSGRSQYALSGEAARLAMISVEVIGEIGVAGLTHRAVAERAGVTAGAVAHYFRTSERLLSGALQAQADLLLGELAADSGSEMTARAFSDGLRTFGGRPSPPHALQARRALFLATARDSSFAPHGAVIRYAQGGTVEVVAAGVLDRLDDRNLVAGVISRLSSALWSASAGDTADGRKRLADEIAAGVETLR